MLLPPEQYFQYRVTRLVGRPLSTESSFHGGSLTLEIQISPMKRMGWCDPRCLYPARNDALQSAPQNTHCIQRQSRMQGAKLALAYLEYANTSEKENHVRKSTPISPG